MANDENAAYLVTDNLYHTLCSVECVIERIAITTLLKNILNSSQETVGDSETLRVLRNHVRDGTAPLHKQALQVFDADDITRGALHLTAGLHATKTSLSKGPERDYVEITMQRLNQCIKLTTIQHV